MSEALKDRLVLEAWTEDNGETWQFDLRAPRAFDTREQSPIVATSERDRLPMKEIADVMASYCAARANQDRRHNIAVKHQQTIEKDERNRLAMTIKEYRKYKATIR